MEKGWNEKLRVILLPDSRSEAETACSKSSPKGAAGSNARRGSGACPVTEEQRSEETKGPQPEGALSEIGGEAGS